MTFEWVSWDEIKPYLNQLIDMELELMIKYHYPEKDIPRSFSETKLLELEQHLSEGNTYFGMIRDGNVLVGYYWAYISVFINTLRWNLRSLYISDDYKNRGLGRMAVKEGLLKAEELGCVEAVTEYATFNCAAGSLYKKMGYKESRIEVIKTIRGGIE